MYQQSATIPHSLRSSFWLWTLLLWNLSYRKARSLLHSFRPISFFSSKATQARPFFLLHYLQQRKCFYSYLFVICFCVYVCICVCQQNYRKSRAESRIFLITFLKGAMFSIFSVFSSSVLVDITQQHRRFLVNTKRDQIHQGQMARLGGQGLRHMSEWWQLCCDITKLQKSGGLI